LDRAAEVGLLTPHGSGAYTIHPALPWFFKGLFDEYYSQIPTPEAQVVVNEQEMGTREAVEGTPALRAARAFIGSMGIISNNYFDKYEVGNRGVLSPLRAEEANLLHAYALTRQHGWVQYVTMIMMGLQALYVNTGRRAEWKRLVNDVLSEFVGQDNSPLPGLKMNGPS
jgi:hypothetical protein